jgi:hypothetical protein
MGWGIIKQGLLRPWPGSSLVAVTLALSEVLALLAIELSALAVGLITLVALVSTYRWSDIIEKLGKWVRIWCGMIVPVTLRVSGVARQVAGIVVLSARTLVLSEGCRGSKTVVASPAPTRQNKG